MCVCRHASRTFRAGPLLPQICVLSPHMRHRLRAFLRVQSRITTACKARNYPRIGAPNRPRRSIEIGRRVHALSTHAEAREESWNTRTGGGAGVPLAVAQFVSNDEGKDHDDNTRGERRRAETAKRFAKTSTMSLSLALSRLWHLRSHPKTASLAVLLLSHVPAPHRPVAVVV